MRLVHGKLRTYCLITLFGGLLIVVGRVVNVMGRIDEVVRVRWERARERWGGSSVNRWRRTASQVGQKRVSHAGSRTRAAWVKARNPNR